MDSEQKLRELALYISQRSEGDPGFGKTKLYKLLFYSDFRAFGQRREAITGWEYQKLPHGPAPVSAQRIFAELEREKAIAIGQRTTGGTTQERVFALRDPDLSLFSGEEIAIVEQVINDMWHLNARGISDLSHQFIGWRAALENETIPYETSLIDDTPPDEEAIRYGQELIRQGR